jgi:hypothetical protein
MFIDEAIITGVAEIAVIDITSTPQLVARAFLINLI